ncbi:SAM-dependent methyltransferase [Bacteroidota bacterium]
MKKIISMKNENELLQITENYYDSKDADLFYHTIWGGEDIHVGIYHYSNESISTASQRAVEKMALMLGEVTKNTRILDIGSGYGGAARYLASRFGCEVSCLNLSEVENERNIEKNKQFGISSLVKVYKGNFEELPFKSSHFDIVWCEDSILHSKNKFKVLEEVWRVLKINGLFIFTDPMQHDACPEGVLQPILDRIHLEELGSVKKYKEFIKKLNFSLEEIIEMPEQLVNHYSRVLDELKKNEFQLLKAGCSSEYIENMKKGLSNWVNGGKNDYLNWGIFKLRKK